FFFQAEDGIRDPLVTGVQTCALPISTKEPKFDYFKSHLDLQMQAASAWVAAAEGKRNDAIDMLRRAADSEDILGKHPVSPGAFVDRKSTRLNSSHEWISYAVFGLKKK